MLKYSFLALGLLVFSACSEPSEPETSPITPAAETAPVPSLPADALETPDSRGPATNGLTEVTPSDIAPSFERDTVIGLNAIVSRSLETIEAYDDLRREIRRAERIQDEDEAESGLSIDDAEPALTSEEALSQMEELKAKSAAALADLTTEAERLKASNEIYNEAILAGMLEFATDVDNEITATLAEMQSAR